MSDESERIVARLLPDGSARAADNLKHSMTAVIDESIAAMILADGDGSALRSAGFTAIADAIYCARGQQEAAS